MMMPPLRPKTRSGSRPDRPRPVPASKLRVWIVVAVIAFGFVGVLWKSARLQLILGDDLRGLAEEQYLRKVTVQAPRGAILDADGRELAVSLPAWSIFAEPRRIVDVEGTAELLASAMGQPRRELASRLDNKRAFVWLDRRVAPDVADRIRELDLPGIGLRKEWRRAWPNASLASQVLGGVNIDGKGKGGVEGSYDERLTGRSTRLDALADNRGDRIAVVDDASDVFRLSSLKGDEVVLTIDRPLQQAAEEILDATRASFNAKAAWAIVLDVKTGAIRAVAQSPAYNPNTGEGDKRNHAFADAFEPASIFKVATFTAAIDAGVLTPTDLIDCENGRYQLGRHTIHDTHHSGVITAREVFKESSNIGALKVAGRMSEEQFRDSLDHLGFGKRTGTGFLDESPGRMPKGERWGQTRMATVAFGHGLMVTSLQMVSLAQAIANGGVRMQPFLVQRVQSADGAIVEEHVDDGGERIMRPETALTMTAIMESVVEPGGTGTLAAIPGVRVAGKTGTGEKVDPNTGRYSKEFHLSSFVGFAPAEAPQVVALVVVDEPMGKVYGGQTAGPAWRAIVERALLLDQSAGNASLETAFAELKKQTPARRAAIVETADRGDASGDDVSDGGAARLMPDLRGTSARAALRSLHELGVDVVISGHGLVSTQEPKAGAPLVGPVQLTLEVLP